MNLKVPIYFSTGLTEKVSVGLQHIYTDGPQSYYIVSTYNHSLISVWLGATNHYKRTTTVHSMTVIPRFFCWMMSEDYLQFSAQSSIEINTPMLCPMSKEPRESMTRDLIALSWLEEKAFIFICALLFSSRQIITTSCSLLGRIRRSKAHLYREICLSLHI